MTRTLYDRDCQALSRMQNLRFFPLAVKGGEGSHLIEADGRRVLDLSATWGAASLGHGHPAVREAVTAALANMAAAGILSAASEPAVRLAEKLLVDHARRKRQAGLARPFRIRCQRDRRPRRDRSHGTPAHSCLLGGVSRRHGRLDGGVGPFGAGGRRQGGRTDAGAVSRSVPTLRGRPDRRRGVGASRGTVRHDLSAGGGCCVLSRADPGGRRSDRPASRVLRRARSPLRPPRHPDGLRRGEGRAGPHRTAARLRARGFRAGHHRLRQGARRRAADLGGGGSGAHHEPPLRLFLPDVAWQPGFGQRGARGAGDHRGGGAWRAVRRRSARC